jgi:hypothetical protein
LARAGAALLDAIATAVSVGGVVSIVIAEVAPDAAPVPAELVAVTEKV